ncbi:MAG TPA: histidine triad nucleotide-binding protein [bacterium]|nr:histidine triad nucleotide-binding protein [bacterium]
MDDCIFCKIASGEIPSKVAGEGKNWIAFHDVNPQAPVHILVIPRLHFSSPGEIDEKKIPLTGELLQAAGALAGKMGLDKGYRLVINSGSDAGQAVDHLHVHLLAGRRFSWPPG